MEPCYCGALDCPSCYTPCNVVEETNRPHLEDCGYEYDPNDAHWSKVVSVSTHTARKDHKRGPKKGDRYCVTCFRCINDEDGTSFHFKTKYVIKAA